MSEKNTDHYMQNAYESIFNHEYHTETNPIFNGLIPNGWDIIDNILIIIENKRLIKDKNKGRDQLFNYYDNILDDIKTKYNSYLILGLGSNKKSFKYVIYDSNKNETKLTLQDLLLKAKPKHLFNEKEIRNLNQYLYDNSITLSKSQKTLFIASVLICLKIDENILSDYDESSNSYLIADKMITVINDYFSDSLFTNNFNFIKKSIHNKHLYHIFNTIKVDIKQYGKDILNQFYSEFCIWDRNNDGKLGIVLTPDDIVDLMVNESFKCYCEVNNELNNSNIKLIDFCTGTGSFLIKGSKFTKALYGCECGDERYSLAKCNFILHDLDYHNLKYNSCFNEPYESNYFDISIINPPFSNKCKDSLNPNNTVNWNNYTKEQRFIMYQLELLKIGGIGCCIVPRSNFNNNIKATNNFKHEFMKYIKILKYYKCNNKVFMPNANVECVIIIYQKVIKSLEPNKSLNVQIIDYSNDGYKLKKNIRIKESEPKLVTYYKDLQWDDDFNELQEDNNYPDIIKLLLKDKIDREYYQILDKINENKAINENAISNKTNLRTIKLSDFLEPIKLKTFQNDINGTYPLYGATKLNKESGKCINYSIDTFNNDDLLIQLYGICLIGRTGNGGAGYLNVYKGIFGITNSVLPCKIKIKLSELNLLFISVQLHKIFNRSNCFTAKDLNINVNIIIDESKINIPKLQIDSIKEQSIKEWKEFRISELLEVVNVKKRFKVEDSIDGNYPLVTRSSKNNGISKFINDYSVNFNSFTIAPSGSTGYCFYHDYWIAVDGSLKVFKLKEINIEPKLIALLITDKLTSKYSYVNGLTNDKILNEIINVPIFE